MVGDSVVAGTGRDDVRTAAAVDVIGPRTGQNDIDGRRTGHGNRLKRPQSRAVDIFEIRDKRQVAAGLITVSKIERNSTLEQKRVGAGATVNGRFCSPIADRIIATTRRDDVRAAASVDGIGPRAGEDRIGTSRPGDTESTRQDAGVDALEVADGDRVTRGLVAAGSDREINGCNAPRNSEHQCIGTLAPVNGDFRAVVDDRVVSLACSNDVGAAAAVNPVVAGAAGQNVGRC